MKSVRELLKISEQDATESIEGYMRELVSKHNASHALIGLSGGIDSAVLATLAVRTLGKDRVKVFYFYNGRGDEVARKSAKLMADWLCLRLTIVPIESIMGVKITRSSFLKILDKSPTLTRFLQNLYCLLFGETPFITTMRKEEFMTNWFRRLVYDSLVKDLETSFDGWFIEIRGYLEALAEKNNTIILGGGNYTELSSGWFTKGGLDDMPYSPIGKLYKTQINQLAEYLEIPEEIRDRASSADVLCGTSDELALGISYDKLDAILYGIEHGLNDENIMDYDVTKKEIKKVREMNRLAIRKKLS
ncbi:MAG: NAD(+) synthase [Candidatus Omnitrophota bacterium]